MEKISHKELLEGALRDLYDLSDGSFGVDEFHNVLGLVWPGGVEKKQAEQFWDGVFPEEVCASMSGSLYPVLLVFRGIYKLGGLEGEDEVQGLILKMNSVLNADLEKFRQREKKQKKANRPPGGVQVHTPLAIEPPKANTDFAPKAQEEGVSLAAATNPPPPQEPVGKKLGDIVDNVGEHDLNKFMPLRKIDQVVEALGTMNLPTVGRSRTMARERENWNSLATGMPRATHDK